MNPIYLTRYSNGVRIPGEPTIPDDMSQPEVKCVGQAGHNPAEHPLEFPWNAPGRLIE